METTTSDPVGQIIKHIRDVDEIRMELDNLIEENIPCKGGHKVDGKTPQLTDLHLAGRTCDCNRMIYRSEGCGCGNKNRELHGYPNQ